MSELSQSVAVLGCALALTCAALVTGCSEVTNNPHPSGSEKTNTLFVPFTSRSPKYLDPASSYSNDETPYTYQAYEPPYQYHYLKRPYELIGRTAEEVARPRYLDAAGRELPDDAPGESVAETVFDIRIKARHPVRAASGVRHATPRANTSTTG